MIIKYDDGADALYIYFREGEHARTQEIAPGIIVDYDENGDVLGIEVLEASKKTSGEGIGKLSITHPEIEVVP